MTTHSCTVSFIHPPYLIPYILNICRARGYTFFFIAKTWGGKMHYVVLLWIKVHVVDAFYHEMNSLMKTVVFTVTKEFVITKIIREEHAGSIHQWNASTRHPTNAMNNFASGFTSRWKWPTKSWVAWKRQSVTGFGSPWKSHSRQFTGIEKPRLETLWKTLQNTSMITVPISTLPNLDVRNPGGMQKASSWCRVRERTNWLAASCFQSARNPLHQSSADPECWSYCPWPTKAVQTLHDGDVQRRRKFSKWFLAQPFEDPPFSDNVLWTLKRVSSWMEDSTRRRQCIGATKIPTSFENPNWTCTENCLVSNPLGGDYWTVHFWWYCNRGIIPENARWFRATIVRR